MPWEKTHIFLASMDGLAIQFCNHDRPEGIAVGRRRLRSETSQNSCRNHLKAFTGEASENQENSMESSGSKPSILQTRNPPKVEDSVQDTGPHMWYESEASQASPPID